jgi:two-component system chemotaxis sensor kinase CheA
VVTLRGTTLPLCRLAHLFRLPDAVGGHPENFVIVIAVGNRRLGVCVERLAGQQDIVIKGLGRSLAQVQSISGATDLGDQQLVLVLDAAAIIEEVLMVRGNAPLALGAPS